MISITTSLFYLFLALGIVLLLWVGGLSLLVLLLRRQLNTVVKERDDYAAQLRSMLSIIGCTATVKTGEHKQESGTVLWIQADEACIQTNTAQITTHLTNIKIKP